MPWWQGANICLTSQLHGPHLWKRLGDGERAFTRRDLYTPVLGRYEDSIVFTQDQLPPNSHSSDINPLLLEVTEPLYWGKSVVFAMTY